VSTEMVAGFSAQTLPVRSARLLKKHPHPPCSGAGEPPVAIFSVASISSETYAVNLIFYPLEFAEE
jgi:hypothetical protein